MPQAVYPSDERELAAFRCALEFYANPLHYEPGARFVHGLVHDMDRGTVAREALGEPEPWAQDTEQHDRTEVRGEYDEEKMLDDRERSKDINSQK